MSAGEWPGWRNSEGYADPTAGAAEARVEREGARMADRVVAGDRLNGRLVSVGTCRYRGSLKLPNGLVVRGEFRAKNAAQATSQWEAWKAAEIGKFERRKEARMAGSQARAQQAAAQGAQKAAQAKAEPEWDGTVYVVQVVGGPGVAWCADFDKAARVVDALAAAAKASGFAAKYDVVEVGRWAE